MSLHEDTYAAFMMDHAAGQHSAALSLAADLHVLLSDQGALTHDVWRAAADELQAQKTDSLNDKDISRACDLNCRRL